jgi:hypothetical protein
VPILRAFIIIPLQMKLTATHKVAGTGQQSRAQRPVGHGGEYPLTARAVFALGYCFKSIS